MIIQSPKNSPVGSNAVYGGAPSMPPLVSSVSQKSNSIDYGVDEKRGLLKVLLNPVGINKSERGSDARATDKPLKKLLEGDVDPSLEKLLKEILESAVQALKKFIAMLNAITRVDTGMQAPPGGQPGRGDAAPGGSPARATPSGRQASPARFSQPVAPSTHRPANTAKYQNGSQYHGYDPTSRAEKASKPYDLNRGVIQGNRGNCLSIASVKAAQSRFGLTPSDIHKRLEKTATGTLVTLRNDRKVHVSRDEERLAAQKMGLTGDSEQAITHMNFNLAVIAKVAQEDGNDNRTGMNFGQALDTLNDGEGGTSRYDPMRRGEAYWMRQAESLIRLGLGNHIRPTTSSELANNPQKSGIVTGGGHAVASLGGLEDFYGTKNRLRNMHDGYAIEVV